MNLGQGAQTFSLGHKASKTDTVSYIWTPLQSFVMVYVDFPISVSSFLLLSTKSDPLIAAAHCFMVLTVQKVTLCFTWRWWWNCVSHFHSLIHSMSIYAAPTMCQAPLVLTEKPITLLSPDSQYLTLLSTSITPVLFCFYIIYPSFLF